MKEIIIINILIWIIGFSLVILAIYTTNFFLGALGSIIMGINYN